MQNKTKLQTIGTALLIPIMLTGCAEQGTQPNNLTANSNSYAAESSKTKTPLRISDDFIDTLNSVIDSSEDIEALYRGIKSADTEDWIAAVKVFEHSKAFIDNVTSSDGRLNDGAIAYVSFNDGSCYITSWRERTTEPVAVPVMFMNIVERAGSVEQLAAEIDGYNRGLGDRALIKITLYQNGKDADNGNGNGVTILENGKLVASDNVWENGRFVRVTYDRGESWVCFSMEEEKTSTIIPDSGNSKNTMSISINSDVMWGMGKTFDEIAEKYGDVTAGNHNVYTFKNGYGKYAWDDNGGIDPTQSDRDENIEIIRGRGGCKIIGEISARDFLVGDLSTLNLDNLAAKCGFEVVPLNPTPDGYSLYDGYKFAYYTHPSYENMTFVMCYKESGFDEEATFRISYDDKI